MRVALIGITEPLLAGLRATLGTRHRVSVVVDATDLPSCAAVASCDVVVHGSTAGDAAAAVAQATRGTWNILTTTGARRYIHLSSMRIFDAYSDGWAVDESWIPRATPDPIALAAHLGEVTAREISRACTGTPPECVALRMDEVVSGCDFDAGPIRPDWLHVDDAISAITAVVQAEALPGSSARWRPIHIVRGDGRYPLAASTAEVLHYSPVRKGIGGFRPDATPSFHPEPSELDNLPPVGPVAIFGAGGPLGTSAAKALAGRHRLLLADRRPLRECPQQSPGAPVPDPVVAPDTERLVDITDPVQVATAATEADCLINCAVVRADVDLAFAVNVLGALNVMEAASAQGVGRVVFTGPALTLAEHPVGYNEDPDIAATVPPRPGGNLYHLTKFLGQEISRIYAEHYRLACPALLYCGFVNPGTDPGRRPHPFSVSWNDAGRSLASAVEIARLPQPFPVLHIHADSPHGRYSNAAARAVLGWEPQDRLDHYWFRNA